MPRKPRFFIPGYAAHVIQRGNNRQAIFFDEADYCCYRSLLGEARDRYGCVIHAYVLMTNHTHLLVTPEDETAISRMMQYVGRQYVPYINNKYERTGTLWEGRFRASIVDSAAYLLACYRYIELNPVRAGMVSKPWEYRWSSYHCNALGSDNRLIGAHREYIRLGKSADDRAKKYRALFEQTISETEVSRIRNHTQSGTPMGNRRFRDEVEEILSIRTGQAGRGRPWVGLDEKH
jgi:putative transposase